MTGDGGDELPDGARLRHQLPRHVGDPGQGGRAADLALRQGRRTSGCQPCFSGSPSPAACSGRSSSPLFGDPIRNDPLAHWFDGAWYDLLGHLLCVIGACIAIISQRLWAPPGGSAPPQGEQGPIVETGPFAISRNPVFVGQALLFIGAVHRPAEPGAGGAHAGAAGRDLATGPHRGARAGRFARRALPRLSAQGPALARNLSGDLHAPLVIASTRVLPSASPSTGPAKQSRSGSALRCLDCFVRLRSSQ